MEIQLNLNPDFERTLESLRTKYSSDFEYINGVHPSQLDYSEFLNNFVSFDCRFLISLSRFFSIDIGRNKQSTKLGCQFVFHSNNVRWILSKRFIRLND